MNRESDAPIRSDPSAGREHRELAELGEWFHNLHLPGGLQTAPQHALGDFPRRKWRKIEHCVPRDLSGWQVLDVGCNAGFYSFELAARGAEVLAVDVDERYLRQARWAARQLDLANPPQFRQLSVYHLQELGRSFDLVWFMGVAYHLRHPLLALDIVRTVTHGYLMFQTMIYPDEQGWALPANVELTDRKMLAASGWPKLAFVEAQLAGDPTNWWVANAACAEGLLRSSGFEILESPETESFWCRAAPMPPLVREELETVVGVRRRA